MKRPAFVSAWAAFKDVNVPVAEVGQKIGGNVQKNVEARIFENACPIRMSYVLNKTGFPVRNLGYAAVSGGDNKRYLFRINDMMEYLKRTFGKPDKTVACPTPSDFIGLQGIIVVKGHGWNNAKGHVTLWNGSICSDTCHLLHDPDNGTFTPETASLWTLK